MQQGSNHRKIIDDGEEYALVIDGNHLPQGLMFYTENEKFVQVASWNYKKGHSTKPHSHNIVERMSNITQEFVYVKHGSIKATLYNDKEKIIAVETLKQGNCILIFKGGHKYDILEDNTEVFEIKNGPYAGIEKDKKAMTHD
jgi:hypothetical protein